MSEIVVESTDIDAFYLSFPPFRFDPANACLWRGDQRIRLRPKTFAVLEYLLTHADRLVTIDELLKVVWLGVHVSATLPKDSVVELRRALGDQARTPRFIETVHGRGYRFIGRVVSSQHSVVNREEENQKAKGEGQLLAPPTQHSALSTQHSILVSRDSALAQLHRRIGERLETAYGQETHEVAALIAAHFVQGHEPGKAVSYFIQAANTATRRFDYQEAIAHLAQALRLLRAQPDTPERDQQELFLQLTLFGPLVALKGYGDPLIHETVLRAQALSERTGDAALQASLASASGAISMLRGELPTARAAGERALQLARTTENELSLIYASFTLGHAQLYQGELQQARLVLNQGIALPHPPHYDPYGTVLDPWLACLSALALTEGFLGYPDQARARMDEAVQRARELGHPYTIGFVLSIACTLRFLCEEHEAAQSLAEAELILMRTHNFSFMEALGTALLGCSLIRQGQWSEGLSLAQQGAATQQALGIQYGQPVFSIFIAEALGQAGRLTEGFTVLAEGEEAMRRSGALLYEAPLYWMRGELLLQRGNVPAKQRRARSAKAIDPTEQEAEICLQHAIAVARRQEAKWFELYATNALSRLWLRQGKKAQARKLLAELYSWFTEGSDTVDLQETKTLLVALAQHD